MSYPAYDAIARDIGLGFSRWRVYMRLQPPVLSFVTPTELKVQALAASIRMNRHRAAKELDWLVEKGYIIEHGRGPHGTRILTLAWATKS